MKGNKIKGEEKGALQHFQPFQHFQPLKHLAQFQSLNLLTSSAILTVPKDTLTRSA
jgi:hypothetical protein